MEEQWKDIKGFEGRYQVSNLGHVRSLERDITTTYKGTVHVRHYHGVMLVPKKSPAGYHYVVLCNSGHHVRIGIHQLVALHFVPGNKDGLIVNHKNEQKDDNRADNLEWCDHTYNNTYGDQFLHRYDRRKKKVLKRNKNGNVLREYESVQEAARQEGHKATVISRWCRKIHKSQDGYVWDFE